MSSDGPVTPPLSKALAKDGTPSSSAVVTEPIAITSACGESSRIPSCSAPSSSTALPGSLPSVSCVSTKPSDVICNPWRNLVSQNRRRYKKDNFDLDLTYITDRIIAMGFPAVDQEKLYRNSMEATVNFLERYHANHYMVFNLRGHHVYDPSYFHNRVMTFEMNDHHPPRLELIAPFCRAVHEYLAADDENVVAVHCKAGKGRTGVMICAYLVYINFYSSPRQNMDYYSIVRTVNNKGVTIPSQRRYVYYFSHLRQRNLNYMPLRSELVGVYFERPPRLNGLLFDGAFRLRVANGDVDVFIPGPLFLTGKNFDEEEEVWARQPGAVGDDHYSPYQSELGKDCISRRCYGWTVPAGKRVFVEGDVRVDLYAKKWFRGVMWKLKDREKLGHIWFNTMFSCPDFCNGAYVHGDEAYPYPEGGTTIVHRWPPVVGREPPSAPPSPPSDNEKSNGVLLEMGGNEKTPVNGKFLAPNGTPSEKRRAKASKKASRSKTSHKRKPEYDQMEELLRDSDIEYPPGLDAHCPPRSLALIYYQHGRRPPREEIMGMLRDAHLNDIISDHYNERRLSEQPVQHPVPKSPEGRPDANGPFCLMRRPDEHVLTFSVLEVDRAFKNEKLNVGTKIHIVLRCVDPENKEDALLADETIRNIRAAQANAAAAKKNEIRRKNVTGRGSDSRSDTTSSSQSSSSLTEEVLSEQPWKDDPRLEDPNLRKYFFKQRRDSPSRHPPPGYRCPLRKRTPIAPTASDRPSIHKGVRDSEAEDFRFTEDGKWLDESSESED